MNRTGHHNKNPAKLPKVRHANLGEKLGIEDDTVVVNDDDIELLRHYLRGLSYRKIADITDLSYSVISTRIKNILEVWRPGTLQAIKDLRNKRLLQLQTVVDSLYDDALFNANNEIDENKIKLLLQCVQTESMLAGYIDMRDNVIDITDQAQVIEEDTTKKEVNSQKDLLALAQKMKSA